MPPKGAAAFRKRWGAWVCRRDPAITPAELSGGQQQRVAIARALAGSPRLLLADEPTGNLDTQMARGVLDLLEELHRDGATIVMVTHDPELAVRAQREVHIVDGQVVDLAAQPRLVATASANT